VQHLEERNLLAHDASFVLGGGEPTVNPLWGEWLNIAAWYNSNFATNALIFDKKMAQLASKPGCGINVSVDAGTEQTYHKVKGVDAFRKVWDNISKYVKYGSNISVKYIFLPENCGDEDINGFIREVVNSGVKTILFSRNLSAQEEDGQLLEAATKILNLAKFHNISVSIKGAGYFNEAERKKIHDLARNSETIEERVDEHWSNIFSGKENNVNWWNSKITIRHINQMVSDTDSHIPSEGLNQLLLKRLGEKRLKLGVSVGCGSAHKEIRLMQLGIVDKFLLFDLSHEAIRQGTKRIGEAGLLNRVEFHKADAFSFDFSGKKIDFVHWNNSLHHMLDVDATVKWSRDILVPGGMFYMDDYVGASRFQHPQNIRPVQ